MSINEYDDRLFREFHRNPRLKLLLSFGSVKSGYELRFTNDYFSYDIFFLYPGNSTMQWNGYYEEKMIYK